jgi:hypothetical protein
MTAASTGEQVRAVAAPHLGERLPKPVAAGLVASGHGEHDHVAVTSPRQLGGPLHRRRRSATPSASTPCSGQRSRRRRIAIRQIPTASVSTRRPSPGLRGVNVTRWPTQRTQLRHLHGLTAGTRSYRQRMDLVALRHGLTSRPRGKRLAAATAVTALVAAGLGIAGSVAPVYAAGVINVPADQPTIQAAVAAAATGDTILIAPGTYTGGVWVQDKVLTFASWYQTTGDPSYIDQTIINGYVTGYCGGAGACAGNAVLEFGSRAGGSLVNGLTIQNGVDGVRGNSRVDITHSKLTLNGDGADFGNDSSGTFSDVLFLRNTDDGIDMNGRVSITVVDSTVQENEGDGVEFRMYPYEGPNLDVTFRHNRFIRNSTDGIQLIDSDGPSSRVMRIERNIFDHNGGATVGCLPDQQTN